MTHAQTREQSYVAVPPLELSSTLTEATVRAPQPVQVAPVPVPSVRPAHRIGAIDFVKGMLVILMVVYHWLNYYIGLDWAGYRYLRFLTPSFIFITGYVISNVLFKKYVSDQRRLSRRLFVRGARLLLVFIALNVVADLTLGFRLNLAGATGSELLTLAHAVLIDGSEHAAFVILVPIAYFLMVTPILLGLRSRLHMPVTAGALIILALVWLAGLTGLSANSHVEMMAVGFLGLAVGTLDVAPARILPVPSLAVVAAYGLYLLAITRWNVLFPLQVAGVCLSLLVLYGLALVCGDEGWIQQRVIRLGQYSLFAYVVQIAVLQCLRAASNGLILEGVELLGPFAAALALTVVCVEGTHVLRAHSRTVDRLYRTAFA